jgi:hypothetical protein
VSAVAHAAGRQRISAYVRVERTFNLDLDWTLATDVWRVAPERAAMSLQIPLIAGESVLTPGVEVRKEMALVGLARERAHRLALGPVARRKLELAFPRTPPAAKSGTLW